MGVGNIIPVLEGVRNFVNFLIEKFTTTMVYKVLITRLSSPAKKKQSEVDYRKRSNTGSSEKAQIGRESRRNFGEEGECGSGRAFKEANEAFGLMIQEKKKQGQYPRGLQQ
jgi:hypothetical protein